MVPRCSFWQYLALNLRAASLMPFSFEFGEPEYPVISRCFLLVIELSIYYIIDIVKCQYIARTVLERGVF
jgi:hypothetical protein